MPALAQRLPCHMRGTDHSPPRCAALYGKTGEQALCGIYEWRTSPWREFAEGSEAMRTRKETTRAGGFGLRRGATLRSCVSTAKEGEYANSVFNY